MEICFLFLLFVFLLAAGGGRFRPRLSVLSTIPLGWFRVVIRWFGL